MTPREITIESGPSKFDFLETISFRKYPQQTVFFKIKSWLPRPGLVVTVGDVEVAIYTITAYNSPKISSLEGHGWYFIGCVQESTDLIKTQTWIRGAYDTKYRKGWIEVMSEKEIEQLDTALFGKDPDRHIVLTA